MQLKYYLRNKNTGELSAPFSVLECALIFKREYHDLFEVHVTESEDKKCPTNINSIPT